MLKFCALDYVLGLRIMKMYEMWLIPKMVGERKARPLSQIESAPGYFPQDTEMCRGLKST